ncbi:uncharacterized protein LOC113326308 [Papaver somniferum]|uniref:uncharacterized protein LOC113326308 n=1 Tax=Papaver somniferum TaxID=3469 RepID=UPI000E6F5155|nr:uncharacterized protein LOC113326308 [Papaver somniferum]
MLDASLVNINHRARIFTHASFITTTETNRNWIAEELRSLGRLVLDSDRIVKLGDFGVSACVFDKGGRQRSRDTFSWPMDHGHASFSKYHPIKVVGAAVLVNGWLSDLDLQRLSTMENYWHRTVNHTNLVTFQELLEKCKDMQEAICIQFQAHQAANGDATHAVSET